MAEANTGVYSIKSPNLLGHGTAPLSAYATLTTAEDWDGGILYFSLLWDTNYPGSDILWYVDGTFYNWFTANSSTF